MISIEDVLLPAHVRLEMPCKTKTEAVEKLLDLFRTDARVSDWNGLRDAIFSHDAPAIEENQCGICIAHGRTSAVRSLVLAACRIEGQGVSCPGVDSPLRLVFVAGIPSAFSHDYLRVIGAVARICHSPETLNRLLTVKEPSKFLHLLQSAERV
jgi:mannitol/fructose-specific phosphotransferase system IIA component (Ntr-type)